MHTVVPLEVIFQNQPKEDERKISYMTYRGELVETVSDGGSGYIINRVISTSPKAYLNPALYPGMKIMNNS